MVKHVQDVFGVAMRKPILLGIIYVGLAPGLRLHGPQAMRISTSCSSVLVGELALPLALWLTWPMCDALSWQPVG